MSPDAPHCVWCHKPVGEIRELRVLEPNLWGQRGTHERSVSAHPEHETQARRYYDKVRRFSRVFLFSVLLGCAAPFIFLAFRWEPGIGASLVYLGFIVWLFPFCTETTVKLIGIRNSVGVARALGLLFMLGGVLLVFGARS